MKKIKKHSIQNTRVSAEKRLPRPRAHVIEHGKDLARKRSAIKANTRKEVAEAGY